MGSASPSVGTVPYRTTNCSRRGNPSANARDTSMKTLHKRLRDRQQQEGLWLGNDKLAQPGMSNVNPLDQPKAKAKPKPTVSPTKTLKAKPAAKALKRMPYEAATSSNAIPLQSLCSIASRMSERMITDGESLRNPNTENRSAFSSET